MASIKTTIWTKKVVNIFDEFTSRLRQAIKQNVSTVKLIVSYEEASDVPEAAWATFPELAKKFYAQKYSERIPGEFQLSVTRRADVDGVMLVGSDVSFQPLFREWKPKKRTVPVAWFNNCK